ncbi:TadE-like protein [Sediminihabitans luteus]|uniref:TadE-like protein n=1 Tax=Sediminihabitans luteus TaxID=1138585 RepID=A0A2M9CYF1_9CELL|nr:TadE-like protein [Sediminihabitans luteus]
MLVSALVVALFLGVVQVALVLHVRAVLVDAAGEGARVAARADRTPADGVDRTRALVRDAVSARFAQDVSAGTATLDGLEVVEVTVRAPLPVVGLLGPSGTLTVTGHAVAEP